MAVAHVVPGEGGHVLVVEGLLDEEVVELVHLLLCLVHSEEIYFEIHVLYCPNRCSKVVYTKTALTQPTTNIFDHPSYVIEFHSQYVSLLDSGEDDGDEQECERQVQQEGIDERLRAVHFGVELRHAF